MEKSYIIYYQDTIKNKTVALGTVHSELKDAQKAMRISMARARNRYCKIKSVHTDYIQLMDFSMSGVVIRVKDTTYKTHPTIIYKYRIEEIVLY